jgi:hypothetical protein
MDMLINRLYRTRLQFGYESESSPKGSSARGSKPQYAYAGNDTAQISPLGIVLYTSAQNSEGQFEDLSKQFSNSPFASNIDDYANQAKKIIAQRLYGDNAERRNSQQDDLVEKKALIDSLEQSSQQAPNLSPYSIFIKMAYNQIDISGAQFSQPTVNTFA